MKKLTLKIDELTVETFDLTAARAEGRGTVLGASESEPEPVTDAFPECFQSHHITGACCEHTFALSCIETNCEFCGPVLVTVEPCEW